VVITFVNGKNICINEDIKSCWRNPYGIKIWNKIELLTL
jgi:hypothetical protein